MPGSRAFVGAFETEGLEGCCGDSGANRRFVELAPQHVRRRAVSRAPTTPLRVSLTAYQKDGDSFLIYPLRFVEAE